VLAFRKFSDRPSLNSDLHPYPSLSPHNEGTADLHHTKGPAEWQSRYSYSYPHSLSPGAGYREEFSVLFPWRFELKFCVHFALIFLPVISLITFCEGQKQRSTSLRDILLPLTSFHLRSTHDTVPKHPNLCSTINVMNHVTHPHKAVENIII